MAANNSHLSEAVFNSVLAGERSADVSLLAFRNPSHFVAGGLHDHPRAWSKLASFLPPDQSVEILDWIYNKVDVTRYFSHFKGGFKGEWFDTDMPPARIFPNNHSCVPFAQFISDTILQRLASGAISLWGKVGEVQPPHLVMPLTVEPSKPRLCNDTRFLNLWMVDRPFRLDHLQDLPWYVSPGSYQTVCDDKSGYDHILIRDSSKPYLGFEWGGWYFTSNTIPFGWKLSAYLYHATGSLASQYFRTVGIPCSLYIDDRHSSHIRFSGSSPPPVVCASTSIDRCNFTLANVAIFVVCYVLIALGYTIGLDKSVLIPSQSVPYLGFDSDSLNQAFRLLPKKKAKFLLLLRDILSRKHISLHLLQRWSGKCISLSAAVPAARLFTNEINMAISKASRSSKPVRISQDLRREIEHWLFLESWTGYLPWRTETHYQIKIHSDASSYAWGGVLNPGEISVSISDYWSDFDLAKDIVTKETLALSNVLAAFAQRLTDSWVDVYVDNRSLVDAWKRQGARSHSFSDALKSVFMVAFSANFHLNLIHIPSHHNVADAPSRTLSLQDATLAAETWGTIQSQFGGSRGHSVDLMALPSNVMVDRHHSPLPFISPFPTPGCLGVNIFAQCPSQYPEGIFSNPYVFPPIVLIPRVLRYLRSIGVPFTIVVPDVLPRRSWWSILRTASPSSILLAYKNQSGPLLVPSKKGFTSNWPLPWDLWVFRFDIEST